MSPVNFNLASERESSVNNGNRRYMYDIYRVLQTLML